jgi:phage baseplate assembly protein W
LLLTNKGERVYYPTFGCEIRTILFENSQEEDYSDIFERIQDSIINAIKTWMPYVNAEKDKIQLKSTDSDIKNNIIRIEIEFTYRINDFINSAPQIIQITI